MVKNILICVLKTNTRLTGFWMNYTFNAKAEATVPLKALADTWQAVSVLQRLLCIHAVTSCKHSRTLFDEFQELAK